MNINTRDCTIKFTATEEGWLDSIKSLAANAGCQSFMDGKATDACDRLESAIGDFRDEMRRFAPKKKAKATA